MFSTPSFFISLSKQEVNKRYKDKRNKWKKKRERRRRRRRRRKKKRYW